MSMGRRPAPRWPAREFGLYGVRRLIEYAA
jgi:hypothetical protein